MLLPEKNKYLMSMNLLLFNIKPSSLKATYSLGHESCIILSSLQSQPSTDTTALLMAVLDASNTDFSHEAVPL